MKDDALRKIETQVFEGFRSGMRHEELSQKIIGEIDPRVGNIRARADLIARDQISKLNGQFTELRQTELGLKRYTWRTVGDERVRESHSQNDGKVFSWNSPPEGTGHPGDDFQCRCYAEPVFEDLVPELEPD
jgi:SPP1 gp7 family putative phage head morphogenesis protein